MAAVIFETQKCAESLVEVGVPRKQANRYAELMAESFVHYADKLVTRDYLDARLDGQWEKIDSRFAQMQAEFDGRFVQMQASFDGRFAQMRSDIDMRFAQMQAQLDGRFAQMRSDIDMRFAAVHSKFTQLFWMMGIGFTVLVIPQLQAWFS
jgi:DNA anti-recombination protein RmuC